jgi:hypothetical protein
MKAGGYTIREIVGNLSNAGNAPLEPDKRFYVNFGRVAAAHGGFKADRTDSRRNDATRIDKLRAGKHSIKRSGSRNRNGFNRTAYTTLKMAVLAAMARATVSTTAAVNNGVRSVIRSA